MKKKIIEITLMDIHKEMCDLKSRMDLIEARFVELNPSNKGKNENIEIRNTFKKREKE